MAFGQPSGPPATAAQMRELLALVLAAGHTDFRDARGPLQLTQRQAAGKFTRDEAEEYICRLQAEAEAEAEAGAGADTGAHSDGGPRPGVRAAPRASSAPRSPGTARRPRSTTATTNLDAVSSEALAAELQSRGWVVLEP